MSVRASTWRSLARQLSRYPEIGALAGFLAVFIGFSLFAERFLTLESLSGIMTIAAELGIVAVGITFLMIAGEFDLSVGSVLGVGAMAFALLAKVGWPHGPAFLLAMGLAGAIGLVNGLLVIQTRIPSFIVTLGTMMFWRGVLLAVTGGFPVVYEGDSWLLSALGGRFAGGFHTSLFWFILIVLIFQVVLTQTRYGNGVYATGGDPGAARALGVNVARTKLINFVLSAMLAALAGIIQFSRFKSVDPLRGQEWELQAIAAAVIGGTLLTGGYGSILGTALGVMMVGMVRSGLVLAGAPAYWYRAFIGVILIAAVIINVKVRGR